MVESLAGKRVLVTGATGFLGEALTRRLAAEEAHVRALARNAEKAARLRDVDGVEIVMGNIGNAHQMRDAAQGCEVAFHVAASTDGPIEKQRNNNVEGTRHVAEAAAQAAVKRLVHVSTIAVYGYRAHGDVTEEMPMNPGEDPYNITKAEAEIVAREIGVAHGLAYSIIRPGMIYGPRSNTWTGSLFRLARLRPTLFIGRGSGSAFPIYIDDVADMMLVLATHPAAAGKAFNCAPDPSPTWRELVGAYSRLAGHQRWLAIPPVLFRVFAQIVATFAKPKTQAKALPDMVSSVQQETTFKMTKARDLLGWQAKIDLQTGIERCAPWLREEGLLR